MDTIIRSFIPMGNPASSNFQTNPQATATQILWDGQKSSKTRGAELLKIKFQTENPPISGATTQNFVIFVTWHPRSVHP